MIAAALAVYTPLVLAMASATPGGGTVTVDLPPGLTMLHAPLAIPSGVDEVVIDGHGRSTLVGGLVIESPAWREPDAGLLARLPDEARGHVGVLALPAESLAAWKTGLAGPVHFGHGTKVAAAPTEVFLGDRPLVPARWPNEGWAEIATVIDAGSVPRTALGDVPPGERTSEGLRGAVFVPKDASRLARWVGGDVWMHGFWNWDWSDEQLPVASIDVAAGTVTLGMPHHYGVAQRGRFRVTNALAELDAPGEMWLDREGGRVVAWVPEGAEREPVIVSMLAEPLIRLPGGADAPRVRVTGVAFRCTRGAAIVGEDVRGATIEGCSFRDIGTRGVSLVGTGCRISRCGFVDVGGIGVSIDGGDRASLRPGENVVEDCTFTRCSRLQRTYNPAIEVAGVGQRIVHNEVSDLPHMAITFAGNEHRFEANHIHHVVQETGDAGAIYTGRDWTSQGNVLRGNLVHDIKGSDARYQNAIYLDDMASGITVESNLLVRCNWGMLVGGGRDDVVRDNAFVDCHKAISYDARGVGWMAKNIADPETSTLHQRLAAVPIGDEPWRSRYPTLGAYLTDRFGRPVGGKVVGNTLLATPLGRIEDRACVEETGTLTLPEQPPDELAATCERLIREALTGSVTIGHTTLGPVGPRRAATAGGGRSSSGQPSPDR